MNLDRQFIGSEQSLTERFVAGELPEEGYLAGLRALGYFGEEAQAMLDIASDDKLHRRLSQLIDGIREGATA